MDPVVPRKRKSHLLAPKHAAPTTSESQWVGRARDQARDSGGSVEKAVSSIARDFDFKKRFSDASEIPRDQEESGSSVAEEENDDRDDSIVSSTASCSEKRNWEPIMPLMDGNPDNMTMSDPGTSISSGDLEIRLSKIEQTLEEMPDKILEALRTRNILGLRDSSLSTSEDRDEDSGDFENYTGPKHLEVPTEVLDSGKVGRKYYKLTVADVMKYAQLTEIDVRMIAKEVRGALTSGTYGIDATKRFMSHPPSTIKTFCRRISSSVALRDLHLGQRTIPPYWPIERASIVYVNNAMRLLRTKERGLKRARDAQSGDDGDDGDNDTLPKDFVDKIDFDQTPSGTCFGFLTEDAARLCGAIAENVDCSTQHGMDPLCTVLTAPDQSKALGTPPPSVDFIVVTILKMSHAFGRNVTVPWKELYAAGPEHDLMEKSGWLLRPGQVLLWRKENVWVMSENESIIPLKTGLPARGGRKR